MERLFQVLGRWRFLIPLGALIFVAVMALTGLPPERSSGDLITLTPSSPTTIEVVDVPRAPAPTTTTTVPPTTTTTVPPTTTTTPTTVPAPAPEPEPEVVSAPAPAPEPEPEPEPTPTDNLWGTYSSCSRGYATGLEVIPGSTSSTTWNRVIQISEFHLGQGGFKLCWVYAHEDGHAYGRTLDPNGWTPPGWPYGVERFADCYAEAVVGGQYGSCPDMSLALSLM
jgi:hypothetical protein